MRDYQLFARGSFQVDWEERIDFARLRSERVKKTQWAMHEKDIDALILWKDENVRYLTSLRAIMLAYRSSTQFGVLLTQEESPVLFASSAEAARIPEAMPWIEHLVPIPIMEEPELVENIVKNELVRYMEKFGVARGRVGLDAHTFTQRQMYERYLPHAEFVDGESFMYWSRIRKLPDEVKCLQEATAIADAVVQTALDAVRAGVREYEVAAEAMATLFRLGGEFAHLASPFVASGEHMSPPTRFPTDKLIRNGDIVFIDIGAMWNGYFGDVGRATICGGRASEEQKRVYTAVNEVLQAGIEAMQPGNTNRQATKAFIGAAAKRGLEKNFIRLFIGHGIGISSNEPPYIGEVMPGAGEVTLEPGMVFAVEPLIWLPGIRGGGGVRLEDMVLITHEGPHVMSRAPYCEELMV